MNVLKKVIFALILLGGSNICFAQEISIRGGFNLSQMQDKFNGEIVSDNPKLKPGFSIGPVIGLPIYSFLSLETGLIYSTKGLLNKGLRGPNETKYSWSLNVAYLEVPFQLRASLPLKKLSIFGTAGAYIASGLFGSVLERENIANNLGVWHKVDWNGEGVSIKRFDYGLDFGFGAKLKYAEVGICYQIGVANLTQFETLSSLHNRYLELYLTYNLWKKNRKTNT
jgi:hypothetical protein